MVAYYDAMAAERANDDRAFYLDRATAPDGSVVNETSHRVSMLSYQQVELLARASPFEEWTVDGDFDGEPLEDGAGVQAWRLEKRAR